MQPSLTDAIARAIAAELQRRRSQIDGNDYLSSVAITVHLQAGPAPIRSITYEDRQAIARASSGQFARVG